MATVLDFCYSCPTEFPPFTLCRCWLKMHSLITCKCGGMEAVKLNQISLQYDEMRTLEVHRRSKVAEIYKQLR